MILARSLKAMVHLIISGLTWQQLNWSPFLLSHSLQKLQKEWISTNTTLFIPVQSPSVMAHHLQPNMETSVISKVFSIWHFFPTPRLSAPATLNCRQSPKHREHVPLCISSCWSLYLEHPAFPSSPSTSFTLWHTASVLDSRGLNVTSQVWFGHP